MILTDFDGPANYQILVKGLFNDERLLILGSAKIDFINDELESHSKIEITVKDQAHLSAVLISLYDNRHVIIKVENVGMPKAGWHLE